MIKYIVYSKEESFLSRFKFLRSLTEITEHMSRTAIDN